MRNLFHFLRRHYIYFLFLLLEGISLSLFFSYNEYQQNKLNVFSETVSGTVNALYSNISEYFSLRKTNKVLIEEMARLHSRLPDAFYRTDTRMYSRKDSLMQIEYRYIGAKVISNTTQKRNNFLMINKGKIHGIENHMGVIIGNKIVGQVVSVSPRFSWIMSVLNKDSRISAKFKKNNQLVNVEWAGGNYRVGDVKEIPKHVRIIVGDTIITSGNSDIFPEGILIGTVKNYTIANDENFNYAVLWFATDFNSLGYVEVVVDLMHREKDELKSSLNKN